jgi:tetratricopeptide (TPR) repeat protein
LAVTSLALLWPWIHEGRLPSGLSVIAVIVLLVNLLAAGGIGFAGVAGSLWLLMALGLNSAQPRREMLLSRGLALAILALVIATGAACFATAYRPVSRAVAAMRAAENDPRQCEHYLKQAAAADPLYAEPWKQLAALSFRQWQATQSDTGFQEFELLAAHVLDLKPNSAAAWFHFGEQYRIAFELSRDQVKLGKAAQHYRQAVYFYPARSFYRARLALALDALGDSDESETEANEALRLDGMNPHADKKLTGELRDLLVRIISNRDNL